MDRLIPDPEGHGARQADVVIEAIFENLEAKHALLQDSKRDQAGRRAGDQYLQPADRRSAQPVLKPGRNG
jgi:hypothetical protein